MAAFNRVTDELSVSAQLWPEDIAAAARAGFRTIVNNRPDGEEAGQPLAESLRVLAEAEGLKWVDAPVAAVTLDSLAAAGPATTAAEGPVLAYCRSGTRSIMAWALAEAAAGRRTRDELVALGQSAGYDLSRLPL